MTLKNFDKYIFFIIFAKVLPKQKLLLLMRKCQKFPLKLVIKSDLLADLLMTQLYFVSAAVHISRIGSAVRHCAGNRLLFQNTTVHITAVALEDVICLGRRSRRAFFTFSLQFSRLLSANSTQNKSFRVEL